MCGLEMEGLHFFLLSMFICTALARPKSSEGVLAQELRGSSSNYGQSPYDMVFSQQDVQEGGIEDGLCVSVSAATSKLGGGVPNTPIHFCQQGSGVCFTSLLKACCNINQDSRLPPLQSTSVTFGTTFNVNFIRTGGFGPDSTLCHVISDAEIKPCQDCNPECTETDEVCLDNIEPGTTCDPITGCTCKRGYVEPTCCECDGPEFVENPIDSGICEETCRRHCARGSIANGCFKCNPGFQLIGVSCCQCAGDLVLVNDSCVCPGGLTQGSNNQCFLCRPDQQLNENDECECREGIEIDGKCETPCENNCVSNQTHGCGRCKKGFQAIPLCCNCTSDRTFVKTKTGTDCICNSTTHVINPDTGRCEPCRGNRVPMNGVCVCPTGTVPDPENQDNCITCSSPKIIKGELCVCPDGTEEEEPRGDCISIIECGKNQEIIFVMDISQSFGNSNFRNVIEAVGYILSALKQMASNDVSVGVVLYPSLQREIGVKRASVRNSSQLFVNNSLNCQNTLYRLKDLAEDIEKISSDFTRAYDAMKFIRDNVTISSTNQQTTIFTITEGPSTPDTALPDLEPLVEIREQIEGIRRKNPGSQLNFYAVGVGNETSLPVPSEHDEHTIEEELDALTRNISSHYVETRSEFTTFITEVMKLLVEAKVLCGDQRKAILTKMSTRKIYKFRTCVIDKDDRCFPTDLCATAPAPAQNDLENSILDAIRSLA